MINITFFLDKRTSNAQGRHPIKIIILFPDNIVRSINRLAVTESEWVKLNEANLRNKQLLEIRKKMDSEKMRANTILTQLESCNKLTRENFLKLFDQKQNTKKKTSNSCSTENENLKKNKKKVKIPIYTIFEKEVIAPFSKVDSGTYENYGKALKSFRNFKEEVKYSDITPQFFKDYETFMLNNNLSLTTVGIYCRPFRRAIIIATKAGFMKAADYPFGKRKDGKYPIPQGKRKKRRTLEGDDLKNFIYFESEQDDENYAKDITSFSFYCNGMNMRDVFQLHPGNVTDSHIYFVRKKTERMTNETITIKVPLTPNVKRILAKWGTRNPQEHEYIFPLLNPLLNQNYETKNIEQRNILFKNEVYRAIKNEIRRINRLLLKIEKKINSPIHLSTEIGRYTWTNLLERNGAPLKLIQAGLGHTRPETTLHYLEGIREEDENPYIDLLKVI